MKRFLIFLGVALVSIWVAQELFKPKGSGQEKYLMVLNQIQETSKLISAEGEYFTRYTKDKSGLFGWGIFSSSVTISCNLRVGLGYDLSKMHITPNPDTKTFLIDSVPKLQILYIDPQMKVDEMDSGLFTSVSKDELNGALAAVRNFVQCAVGILNSPKTGVFEKQVLQSQEVREFLKPLYDRATRDSKNRMKFIEDLANSIQWRVTYLH